MNASAAVPGLFRMPHAGAAFRHIEYGEDAAPPCHWEARVENIKSILTRREHTVTQLSAFTRRRYGTGSPYFIPATFLYKLRSGITPHICQVAALSEITGYRFVDWLRACGFDLRQIPRLQMRLHPERTVLVTPAEDTFDSFLPQLSRDPDEVWNSSAGARSQDRKRNRRYLFAKIGTGDARANSRLLPGSLLRIDRYYDRRICGLDPLSVGHLLWLVEQSSGLTCCRVRWIDDQQIVLLPSRPAWGSWPLRLPTEARILGLVDMDLGPLKLSLQSRAGPTRLEPLFPPHGRAEGMRFSDMLRISRGRTGLTFRAAHRLTRAAAQILGNHEYAIALGMLSDYEAMGRLPRHIAKILSLCAVYCMDALELMEAAGVRIDDAAKMPLPWVDGRLRPGPEFLDHPALPPIRTTVSRYPRSARI